MINLTDIKIKEKTMEALMKGKNIYEPPRFMSVNVAVKQLLEIMERRLSAADDEELDLFNRNSQCIGLARLGADDECIKLSTLSEMVNIELGDPLHSLVIPGKLHPLECDMINMFS